MSFHPHVHCIVSGGGVKDGHWVADKRKKRSYLFPKAAIEKVFKAYYLRRLGMMLKKQMLKLTDLNELEQTCNALRFKRWNVYAKRPFGGPMQVLEYLGRYTHKVAITTHRILNIDEQAHTITFSYKDYHKRGTAEEKQEMTLSTAEFARRFEQHILPMRYTKIRHYGYLKNYQRRQRLETLFASMNLPKPPPKVRIPIRQRLLEYSGEDIMLCPSCKQSSMKLVATYYRGVLCKTYEEDWTSNKAPP